MSEPIRVLHVGDLHLGVELYGRPDPEKGYGTRVGDFLAALDGALEHAAEADLVLFPGDIYKNCDPTPTVQREFAARVARLARERPVVIIPGNHDVPNAYARATSVEIFRVLEVENVHILRTPVLTPVRCARGVVLIAPLPYIPRSRLLTQEEARGLTIPQVTDLMRGKLVDAIDLMAREATEYREAHGEDVPAVLMAHYTIAGAVFGGYGRGALLAPDVELPLSAVKRSEFDYVALAHIHKHQSVPANDVGGQPPVVYPGSVERVDFGEEDEDKVAVLAEVSRGRAAWRAVPLRPRPFVTVRVTADEADPLRSVLAAIEKRRAAIAGAVVRLSYTLPSGHPNLPERELRAALEGSHYVAGIRRETPALDARVRDGLMTTQLTPLQALDQYLKTQPHLASQRDELYECGRALIAEVLHDPDDAGATP